MGSPPEEVEGRRRLLALHIEQALVNVTRLVDNQMTGIGLKIERRKSQHVIILPGASSFESVGKSATL
jgi:hypothetical protein